VNKWHYIAWHTPDEWYTKHAEELVQSVLEFGGKPIEMTVYDDFGGWVTNGMNIPHHILASMDETEDDLVYLDVDARVRQYPALFDTIQETCAFHVKDGKEVLCGTVFIKNNERGRKLVEEWIARQEERYPDHLTAQVAFEDVVNSGRYSVFHLPPSYTQIFDSMAHHGKPVIEHMQASRQAQNYKGGQAWKNR